MPARRTHNPTVVHQIASSLGAREPVRIEASTMPWACDVAAVVSDGLAFMTSHAKAGDKPEDTLPVIWGKGENLKISGDTATATYKGNACKFTRVNGRWFVRIE